MPFQGGDDFKAIVADFKHRDLPAVVSNKRVICLLVKPIKKKMMAR